MSIAELEAFVEREFPEILPLGARIEDVDDRSIRLRLPANSANLRPGGTISGPTMFALADVGMWLLVLAQIGPQALAVTTSVTMNFLRKPPHGDLIAEGELLKLGQRLAVGHFRVHAADNVDVVADASLTYSIPPPTPLIKDTP